MNRILFLAASIYLLAACSGFEPSGVNTETTEKGDLVERVVFDVIPIVSGDDAETKASAVPDGINVNFAWEATDTIAVFPDKGSQAYFTIDESNVGRSSAIFDGGGWALKQGESYISYYPLVGEFYLDRTKIPVSFSGQKQIGTEPPFSGARYFLATDPTSSDNGELHFSYKTLNTIINVNATLPAGTYTKAQFTIEEPLFVEEGTYSLDDQTIVGTKYSTMLKMDLEDVTLSQDGILPIYFMSAPVDLKNKQVTVKVISDDGKKYECVKTPSRVYDAGKWYGLNCTNMVQENAGNISFADANIKAALVAAFDTDEDGELSYMEAAAVTSIEGVFGTKKTYTSFNEFQYFTGVTTIPESMFQGWQISSIVLPESLSNIGLWAFKDCVKLTSIDIPNSVYVLGGGAFQGCIRLSSVSLQGSFSHINEYTFFGCTNLVIITIPESVTSIGLSAFEGCSSLTNVTLPESITTIGNGAFHGCSSLANITLPESVTSIGSHAFCLCCSLTSINIPESVTSIGEGAFNSCSNLASINLPESVTSIGHSAFYCCSSLTSIIIPQGVYKIEGSTFSRCSNLTSITIPESVINIGDCAFYGCSSLTNVTIPKYVTSIGNSAFADCSSLTSIIIPDDVSKIEGGTFAGCCNLESISVPESVSVIEWDAFSGCSSLTSISLPESVISIGEGAFLGCSSLANITLPESVTSIGAVAFGLCSSLTSISIPYYVTSIEEAAFCECSSLTSISLPESVISIGGAAFRECSSLISISIPASVTSIGERAFFGCSSLISIVCVANTPPFIDSYEPFYNTNNCPIFVPAGSVEAYKSADGWSDYADRIQPIEDGSVPPPSNGGNENIGFEDWGK